MGAPGFDDAPIHSVSMNVAHMNNITVVYPYYENPLFLRKQLKGWSKWPLEMRTATGFIVVDDGSPSNSAEEVVRHWKEEYEGSAPIWIRLFRIEVDVRWNWLAARNIGMTYALNDWCVLTDMDHVIPEETMEILLKGKFNKSFIYTFRRREYTTMEEIHRHPNSMFMTKEMFWKVGGYDEALSGHYGSDGDWRRRCAATSRVFCADTFLDRHEYQLDSSTTTYLRKQPEDSGKKAIIKTRRPGWKPLTLSFPFHEVTL